MIKIIRIVLMAGCFMLLGSLYAAEVGRMYESDYVNRDCKGEIEFVTQDGTYIDCLAGGYAIEFDWARKWYEGVGQALYYGRLTGDVAGLVLIVKRESDWKYVERCHKTLAHYGTPVKLWVVLGEGVTDTGKYPIYTGD